MIDETKVEVIEKIISDSQQLLYQAVKEKNGRKRIPNRAICAACKIIHVLPKVLIHLTR